ncbi:MAG TPA: serine/threonine-protein kinase, partial [Terriglobia bacterium]|nr:serine/threonine-protein kinase [Terriglobia bacterium]
DCLGEPVGLAPRLRIAIQVAVALDYLHRRGVVHRDIKPCNILLTERREPRIADFGIATLIENGHSPGGSLPGTPSFVAPELLEDAPPSPRSDIFSFGVLFYWMLTGKIPFDGESVTEIIDRVRRLEPLSVVRHNWALPRELDAVLARCLAKDPAARYGSAGEIASDLTQLLAASRSSASDRHPAPLPAAELPAAGQKVQPIRLPLPAGPQEPAAADSISRAALACHRQGRHAEAERLYCEALRLRRQAFGPCHPQVATTLNNLAMLYSEQGRTELARRLLECSLVIAEKLFGPDHPKTALRRRNLAALRPAKSA